MIKWKYERYKLVLFRFIFWVKKRKIFIKEIIRYVFLRERVERDEVGEGGRVFVGYGKIFKVDVNY